MVKTNWHSQRIGPRPCFPMGCNWRCFAQALAGFCQRSPLPSFRSGHIPIWLSPDLESQPGADATIRRGGSIPPRIKIADGGLVPSTGQEVPVGVLGFPMRRPANARYLSRQAGDRPFPPLRPRLPVDVSQQQAWATYHRHETTGLLHAVAFPGTFLSATHIRGTRPPALGCLAKALEPSSPTIPQPKKDSREGDDNLDARGAIAARNTSVRGGVRGRNTQGSSLGRGRLCWHGG